MGPDAPRNCTIKEHLVLMRGMLPEIAVTGSDLAGTGCVYVRLITDKDDLGVVDDGSSSDEFLNEPEVKIIRVDDAGMCNYSCFVHENAHPQILAVYYKDLRSSLS